MNINLDRFNPEINWKGRHMKIGLVSFVASLYALSQTPAAMVLLGIALPTATAIPAAVNAVVSVAAPIIGALVYNPKDADAPVSHDKVKESRQFVATADAMTEPLSKAALSAGRTEGSASLTTSTATTTVGTPLPQAKSEV